MSLPRRTLLHLAAAATLPAAARLASPVARAQPAAPAAADPPPPPILFLHGNGDHAALWLTTLWRFESNGWPRERLRAVSFPDPLARGDDAVPQPLRSGSAEQTARLAEFVRDFRAETGAARLALVANSRGGYPIRDFVVHGGGAAQVSHAVLCGTPNRGVYDWPENRNSEFNARSDFLRRLNGGATDVVPETAFLTLRSDSDLYAQPQAVWSPQAPERPTGTDVDGPALRGATNLLLPGLDHREVAYHARAFAEIFAFVAGREPAPSRIAVLPEARPVLDGLVTGTPGGVPTNRPVAGAVLEVWRTDPETGARLGGAPLHRRETGADGRWGPLAVAPDWTLEFVLAVPGHPVTHTYRSPFPRSSAVVHLRPARPLSAADREAGGVLLLTRPRGYFGVPRDILLLDGTLPPEVPRGIPRTASATLRLPAAELGRPVPALFNEERVVARAWPAAENRIAVAELTW